MYCLKEDKEISEQECEQLQEGAEECEKCEFYIPFIMFMQRKKEG